MHKKMPPSFGDDDIDLPRLRERAHALRWATVPDGVIPLTAADPDFPVAPEIRTAIKEYVDSGVLSYGPSEGLRPFREAVANTLAIRRGLRCTKDQIIATDGVASAMQLVARFALRPGDEAIVFDPVDFLFKQSVEAVGGHVVYLPVDTTTGIVALDSLDRLISARTRLICVCNPLNPLGRVLTRAELLTIGTWAAAHGIWIMADEIWSDIIYPGHEHISIATLSPEIAARTVTLGGFSKSFGLAGLRVGFLHAPSTEIASQLLELSGAMTTVYGVSTVSQVAAIAAYVHAGHWLDAFVLHLTAMRDLVVERLNGIPGVVCRPPEGTYVVFPDVHRLGRSSEEIADYLLRDARVAVVPGATRWFGPGAEGHIRLCFSTSRRILTEALDRIEQALCRLR